MNHSFDNSGCTGIVFDLQRCSMHDGPGIRTTVFLKGCPLSCKWCHNPESQLSRSQLAYYDEKCSGCRLCGSIHPQVHCFEYNSNHPDRRPAHSVQYQNCTQCGKCVANCPSSALKLFGSRTSIQSLLEIIKKDIPYYRETGGGLTVSGGEPFFQYTFLLRLLVETKKAGISTCVETCGFVTREKLEEAMPYIDMFLFDYKETSPVLHKKFTGVDNALILKNLDFLYHSDKKIILRCPVIPGYNDTPQHFKGIAAMEQNYPNLAGIEILPYHDMGKVKAHAVGADYLISAPTADLALKSKWKEMMQSCNCSEIILNSF